MHVEVEALRRRLNAHFEGVKDELGPWMELQPEGYLEDLEMKNDDPKDVQEDESQVENHGDIPGAPSNDVNSLMEKPGKGRPSSRPEGRRSRTRARSRSSSQTAEAVEDTTGDAEVENIPSAAALISTGRIGDLFGGAA